MEKVRAKAITRAKAKDNWTRQEESLVERKDQEKEAKMDSKEKAHKERVGLHIEATRSQISKESQSG